MMSPLPTPRLAPILLLAALGVACATAPKAPDPAPTAGDAPSEMPPTRAAADALQAEAPGVWISQGYGYLLEIGPDAVRAYDITASTCMRDPEAETEDVLAFLDRYRIDAATQTLYVSNTSDPYAYAFTRVDALPLRCVEAPAADPLAVFDAFTEVMAERYAFFDTFGVDWGATTAAARATLTPESGDAALFDAMVSCLEPLHDGHLGLKGEVDGEARRFKAEPGKTLRARDAQGEAAGVPRGEWIAAWHSAYWEDDIRDGLLAGEGVITGAERIQYGLIGGDIGYLAIMTMGGYTEDAFEGDAEADLAALNAALGDALARFEGAKGVIVDVSLNYGGYDWISRAIASRFAAAPTLAYAKYPGDVPAGSPFAKPQPVYIRPSAGPRFLGPVVLLTSDVTVSAGEIFTLSMVALPNVTHAGEATRGAFSDVLEKALPNGWALRISNEIYVDAKGVCWEGKGVPPEVPIPVFSEANVMEGHRAAVERVVGMLRGEQTP